MKITIPIEPVSQMRYWTDDAMVVEYLPGTGKYYSDSPRWEIEILPMEAAPKC